MENATSFEALYESMKKCQKGVIWKTSVAHYVLNGIEETAKLSNQLRNGTYQPRPVQHFTINYPKKREIASVCFRDRVYQRSLNDNILYPKMTNSFIYDNYACQKGKGTDRARERLKEFLREHYRKHGRDGYILQIDIKGYYPNMSHRVAEEMFQRRLTQEEFEATLGVLRNQYPGERGYNPGSQMIQIAGISILDPVDHFCKERLRLKHYIRYMDDIIIVHHDRDYLMQCRNEIERQIKGLEFELNNDKTRLYSISDGIPFLGFVFTLSDTGKALMKIQKDNVKAQRRKLVRLVHKSKRGELPKESVDESYKCWRNHASKGDNWEVIRRMDGFYESLWRAENV